MRLESRKLGFALVVTALALAAGSYLSGFLALLFLKLNTNAAGLGTYYAYIQALDMPQVAPYAERIRVAGYVGFGLPLLACILLLVLILKPSKQSLHGNARFASAGDLAKHGMFKESDTGLIVGKHNGNLLRLGGQQFVILAAPTRSGKGVGIVIPNLLDYRESVVVLDIKQENFELTSGWRA